LLQCITFGVKLLDRNFGVGRKQEHVPILVPHDGDRVSKSPSLQKQQNQYAFCENVSRLEDAFAIMAGSRRQ
jgi:hypothetical protein